MHGIQTSGNCIRNITTTRWPASPRRIVDPRPYAEILRQWSTLHPEFAFLPRKFKIAITARERPRRHAWHDIGLQLLRNAAGEVGFRLVGGGMGRTPVIATVVNDFVPWQQILATSKPSCASTTCTAGATTSTRRASRSWSRPRAERFVDEVNAEFARSWNPTAPPPSRRPSSTACRPRRAALLR